MTDEQRNIECTKLLTIVHELDRMIRAEITQAQEELARLQSGIAALREQWQARHDAWKTEFDEEMNKRGYTAYAAILGGEWYATEIVLEELDALFPPDASA